MTVYVLRTRALAPSTDLSICQQIAPLLQNEIVARAIEQLSNINKVLTDGLHHLKEVYFVVRLLSLGIAHREPFPSCSKSSLLRT